MPAGAVFISHTSKDDAFVAELRTALEGHGITVWADSRELAGGDPLGTAVRAAIEGARAVLVVLSPRAVNSSWVPKEVRHALEVAKARADGFKVIPLLLDGIEASALGLWFGEEPVAIKVEVGPGRLQEALPALLAALGERLPMDARPARRPEAAPVADLVLELSDPGIEETSGERRARAVATLTFYPADGSPPVESRRARFVAPLGPIEAEELAWYLERYPHWPNGVFRQRAALVEDALPEWGRRLHSAVATDAVRPVLAAWEGTERGVTRRFTIEVDADLIAGAPEAEQQAAQEAATLLLALPWELLRDDRGYLFQGAKGVRVRRRLPNRVEKDPLMTGTPLRVLLLSPRPEDETASYLDHRASALPLVEALADLGDLARLTMLSPPTFPALTAELQRAAEAGEPYHVVHFDGHGVYDRKIGLGALCFEYPGDAAKLDGRRSQLIDAETLAKTIRDHRVPLFFLDACQTAKAALDPTASVAGKLLQGGVASVAAMSHSVLVETARRFVAIFYRELAAGRRIGEAMLAGQRALHDDGSRGHAFTGELELQDWYVPVLFQEQADPPLVAAVPEEQVHEVQAERRRLALGAVPATPAHGFVGRSRDLLHAERLLVRERYVVLRGEGGEGKTAIAAELARWLVATERVERTAWASLEREQNARSVLFALGAQLVPDYVSRAAQDEKVAVQLVERALHELLILLVLDNVESILPPPGAPTTGDEAEVLEEILALCERLGRVGRTKLVFTTREALPAPFAGNELRIGRLERREAIQLVGRVLGESRLMPHAADAGESQEEIEKLVEAVGCHARSLVLLAREVVESGVRDATTKVRELMAALHKKYPDDRERSLIASVELSLRRLPAGMREKIRPLEVFQGGGHLRAIGMVLVVNRETTIELARQLVDVGLAEALEYDYLRLEPALGAALLAGMSAEEREVARARWVTAETILLVFLYQQKFQDARLASTLTLLDLPNLLGSFESLEQMMGPDWVVEAATMMDGLLRYLGRPEALARVTRVRSAASGRLDGWSHARYLIESAEVERLFDSGPINEAVTAAKALLVRAQQAGEDAYPDAAFDLASCYFTLGHIQKEGGAAGVALELLDEAGRRFVHLAVTGSTNAERMVSVGLNEVGDCLRDLGRFDEAALMYEQAITFSEARDYMRNVAAGKSQLGSVRILQGRYAEALAAYTEARDLFERLEEPGSVATAWHQIGVARRNAGQYEAAERAYQESLRLKVQIGLRRKEAPTLRQLGILYGSMERFEEAVSFFHQAIATSVEFGDVAEEGWSRCDAALALSQLGRLDEARRELLQAITCLEPLGHSGGSWNAYGLLEKLELAADNAAAATEARLRAVQAYISYRRDGGESRAGSTASQLYADMAQAITDGQSEAAALQLAELLEHPNSPAYLKSLIPILQAILGGSRDPALADDPSLDYDDAAELLLLLKWLG